MKDKEITVKNYLKTISEKYLLGLVYTAILLGILHCLLPDIKIGGIFWFNMDKENNIPSWFSGALFLLLGFLAMAAYHIESKINSRGRGGKVFNAPQLWIGFGLAGMIMSLDELAFLHEDVFWAQIRLLTKNLGREWIYMAQWQIIFMPLILIFLIYCVIFFVNRFAFKSSSFICVMLGLACWTGALFFDSIRDTFQHMEGNLYFIEVLFEKDLEMFGAIFMIRAVADYMIGLSDCFTKGKEAELKEPGRFFSLKTCAVAAVFVLLFILAGISAYRLAKKQSIEYQPLPREYYEARRLSSPVRENGIWFDDIKDTISLDEQDKLFILRYVREIIGEENPALSPADHLKRDKSPRIVFISYSQGNGRADVALGTGYGVLDAAANAAKEVRNSLKPKIYMYDWLSVDIVRDAFFMEKVALNTPLPVNAGFEGIAFDRRKGVAFLPAELTDIKLINGNKRINVDHMIKYIIRKGFPTWTLYESQKADKVSLYVFNTIGFFDIKGEKGALYRGHRLFHGITKDEILSSAYQAGRYLTQSVTSEGKFVYVYDPTTDLSTNEYSILRHAEAVYAMLKLSPFVENVEILDACRRAIAYMLRYIEACPSEKVGSECVVEDGIADIRGNALTVIALAEYAKTTGDGTYNDLILKLGRRILSLQKEDGSFVNKMTFPGDKPIKPVSMVYSGEVIPALIRVYAVDGDEKWLDAAERNARYVINVKYKDHAAYEILNDHWLLTALDELYRYRQDPLYLNYSLKKAGDIIKRQNRSPLFSDLLGSYNKNPGSADTEKITKGLCSAYYLARDYGRLDEAKKILEAIRLGVGYQLQMQLRSESALYFLSPRRVLGASPKSYFDPEIRIDYVQYNLLGLLGYYNILNEDRPGEIHGQTTE